MIDPDHNLYTELTSDDTSIRTRWRLEVTATDEKREDSCSKSSISLVSQWQW